MKINFMSFGNQKFYGALKRIKKQSEELNIFNNIYIYDDNILKNDNNFWEEHGTFILNNPRFYGYAVWKPYLILKTLYLMNDNDILLYCDAGCELNISGLSRLHQYFNIINNSNYGILSFKLCHLEKTWTKMDLINYFNSQKFLNTPQILSGIIIGAVSKFVYNNFINIYFKKYLK